MVYKFLFCFFFLVNSASAQWQMSIRDNEYAIKETKSGHGFLINSINCEISYYFDSGISAQHIYLSETKALYNNSSNRGVNTFYIKDNKEFLNKILNKSSINMTDKSGKLIKTISLLGFKATLKDLQESCKA